MATILQKMTTNFDDIQSSVNDNLFKAKKINLFLEPAGQDGDW